MTREQLRKLFPNAPESFIEANAQREPGPARVSAPQPKHDSGKPLDGAVSGEAEGGSSIGNRAYIEFHLYALQPPDWDNARTKEIQDLLIEVGLLASDQWDKLQGRVIPHQVKTKKEERTEIKIWYC